MTRTTSSPIGATVLGYPRIGRERQLKKALEAFWSGSIDGAALDRAALSVRLDGLYSMANAGLDSVPVNSFSWYDQMLDTAVLVGAVPDRFHSVTGEHTLAGFDADRYFAMARGTVGVAPLEMTKWFDTNYHYLVPEIGLGTRFALHAVKPLAEYEEAASRNITARPVVIGPFTFLALAKAAGDAPDGFAPLSRLNELTTVYAELLGQLADAGVSWVQLDEPALGLELDPEQVEAVRRTYETLAQVKNRPALLVATYFASPVEALPALASTAVDAIALDLVRGPAAVDVAGIRGLEDKLLVLGAVDGRNIWRADLHKALASVQSWQGLGKGLAVSTSCSLQHVPYDLNVEVDLDPSLKEILAFADQKVHEVVALQRALESASVGTGPAFVASAAARAARGSIAGLFSGDVAGRVARVVDIDRVREDQSERDAAQSARLGLPALPTTTIGSFPQTANVRKARADLRAGRIDEAAYADLMR
ncbi:MAG: metE, partial [Aeromicrobium sp.]|nr:metE [Aeromicrobium sp.]